MKKGTKILSILSLFSVLGAGAAFGINVTKTPSPKADSTSWTPGSLFYFNMSSTTTGSTAWYCGGEAYHKFVLLFTNGTKYAFSGWRAHAYNGQRFMCTYIPDYPSGVTAWTKVSAYCFAYNAEDSILDTTSGVSSAQTASLAYTNFFDLTGTVNEIIVGASTLNKAGGNVASVGTYPSTNVDFDKTSLWCENWILEYTDSSCTSKAYTELATKWSYVGTTLWTSTSSITSTQQNIFKSTSYPSVATRTAAGSNAETIGLAKARYNRIITLHSDACSDWAGLNQTGALVLQSNGSQSSTPLIVVLSGLSAALTASYFFFKKKKTRV